MNWRKHISSYLFDLLLMLVLLIVLILIKGAIDLFTTGQLYLFHYWLLFLRGISGSAVFFALIELISMLWEHH
ncbi:hypothetical protein C5L25_002033 [Secundilactobacillus silagei JCM 19001]|jgi:hypothetical protein|uniref:Uncharacterized protein n=1 Tax=Secundilactobacillus silagei JCM 19001 TaxID=1302250 RepID=A0A1Z5IK05_9LACO|nr:hypothetical protein C5L25_002033 [Secundilactobacillus silagei JCM 19001]GAX02093.1 hypothetical protein IWT126_02157 [Secundilactobacillus silagei JCM 19001]